MSVKARPQLFVGSSSESRRIANAIHQNLDDDADVTVWDQNAFRLTQSAITSLIERLAVADFAIFVFAPDDILELRDERLATVRDNVIFELGLFMGNLGPERTFIVAPKDAEQLRIPTDLAGVTVGRYNSSRQDRNWRAALAPFCDQVRDEIRTIGLRTTNAQRELTSRALSFIEPKELVILEAQYGLRAHRLDVAPKLNSLIVDNRLHVFVGNNLTDGVDPAPNVNKDLRVRYRFRDVERELVIEEFDDLTLPLPDDAA